MNATARLRTFLSKDELAELTAASDAAGFRAVATSWGLIAAAFALAAAWPNVVTIALALVLLGGRQLALAILMHECAHNTLFATQRLNDLIGKWLCAAPVWQQLAWYREHHLKHHRFAGIDKDPDIGLVTPYPASRRELARRIGRDLSGATALRRIVGLLAIDFGYMTYTASTGSRPVPQDGRSKRHVLLSGLRHFGPVVATNAALAASLAATGHAWLYLLWLGAYCTTFSVFVRIRAIAEHACTEMSGDQWRNTRTTYASPLARLTVAPHRVNYHLEHHLLIATPYHKLPRLHALLKERGALEGAYVARSYGEVIALATARCTPATTSAPEPPPPRATPHPAAETAPKTRV